MGLVEGEEAAIDPTEEFDHQRHPHRARRAEAARAVPCEALPLWPACRDPDGAPARSATASAATSAGQSASVVIGCPFPVALHTVCGGMRQPLWYRTIGVYGGEWCVVETTGGIAGVA